MVPDSRLTYWTRWPDEDAGPMWLGIHYNERASAAVLVGVELWTEAPGAARRSLGPEADPTEDFLPWPAVPVTSAALRAIRLGEAARRLREAMKDRLGGVPAQRPSAPLRATQAGRPPLYGPDHFARVAGCYQRALAQGRRDPTLYVATSFGVSRSAAASWVMRARNAGVLGSTTPGRAGG